MANKNPKVRERGIHVRVNDKEWEKINKLAKASRLSNPAYLRELGVGYKPKSKIDLMVLEQLIKIKGEWGKVGGLLKQQISKKENNIIEQNLNKQILLQIKKLSDIIANFNKSTKK